MLSKKSIVRNNYIMLFTGVILFLFATSVSFALDQDSTIDLRRPDNKLAPYKYFSGDSNKYQIDYGNDIKTGYSVNKYFEPVQDTAYARALRLHIPIAVRLKYDFKKFESKREIERVLEKGMPWQIALENLRIRPDILAPLPQDLVHRQEMIRNSLYVPYMPISVGGGISMNLQDIGVFLGLLEDVSPEMDFELKYMEEIEVVIYSVQAVVIATIYKGVKPPGTYRFVWNGRDDKGRPMPPGDYIGEVRIGNSRYIRKHIHLP